MNVALIDPSLFTLPYDAGLMEGLRDLGITTHLHGRTQVPEDGGSADIDIERSFYKLSRIYGRLPAPIRLVLKGIDHGISLLSLLRRLARDKPDIIHFQWLPLPALDRALLGRFRRIAPVVLTVHDTDPFNGDPAARLQRVGFVAALRQCDRLIVHTRQGEKRLLAYGVEPSRVVVLPHGPLGTKGLQASEDVVTTPLTFVLFGKIKHYKGADLLISAFAALPADKRELARVLIVGQSYMDLAPLRQLVASHGLSDWVTIEDRFVSDDEVASIFSANVVSVFPYREIEASGVLSLALANSRPIIASRLGLFAETLTDGVHGRLVQAGETAALCGAMAEMIDAPDFRAACSRNVLLLQQGLPDWLEIARRTASLYAACLRERRLTAAGEPMKLVEDSVA
jgi:glycosyltransferase involved in cell wall biosynthesis